MKAHSLHNVREKHTYKDYIFKLKIVDDIVLVDYEIPHKIMLC